MKRRRVAVLAAGLAMTASVGLTGAGAASAASPALHIIGGSKWTVAVNGGNCQVDTMKASHMFVNHEDTGDRGTWSGGGRTLSMTWTSGDDEGLTFSGTWVSASHEYSGSFGGILVRPGHVVQGVTGC